MQSSPSASSSRFAQQSRTGSALDVLAHLPALGKPVLVGGTSTSPVSMPFCAQRIPHLPPLSNALTRLGQTGAGLGSFLLRHLRRGSTWKTMRQQLPQAALDPTMTHPADTSKRQLTDMAMAQGSQQPSAEPFCKEEDGGSNTDSGRAAIMWGQAAFSSVKGVPLNGKRRARTSPTERDRPKGCRRRCAARCANASGPWGRRWRTTRRWLVSVWTPATATYRGQALLLRRKLCGDVRGKCCSDRAASSAPVSAKVNIVQLGVTRARVPPTTVASSHAGESASKAPHIQPTPPTAPLASPPRGDRAMPLRSTIETGY